MLGHVADRDGKKESKSKGNYTPPEVILDRVRLEFAAVSRGGARRAPGRARVAREDYEGLDLRGESAKVRVYRGDAEAERARARARARPTLPRRVIELAPADAARLGVAPAPAGARDPAARGAGPRRRRARSWSTIRATPAPGADAFRWFFYASNPPWNPTRHSLARVRAAQRELPLKLRNVYSFFTIYANIDGFDPSDANCRARAPARARDARAARSLDPLRARARRRAPRRAHMDAYRVYEATGALTDFVDALSNWYVRRSRERFWARGPRARQARRALDALRVPDRARAPARALPAVRHRGAVAEPGARARTPQAQPESVHLADCPEADAAAIDATLSRAMRAVREIVSLGLQVRTANKLRVRQPLAAAEIVLADPALERRAARARRARCADELNVHEVHFVRDAPTHYVTYQVKPNFRALGPRVGKRMPKLKAALAEADGAALLRQLDADGCVRLDVEGETLELVARRDRRVARGARGLRGGGGRRRRGGAAHGAQRPRSSRRAATARC